MSNELYVIEMRGSAGHAPQEQDEEQGLLISVERMVIIVVIIGPSCPPKQYQYFLIYKFLDIYIYTVYFDFFY